MTIYLHHLRVLKTCACNCHVRNLVPETRRAFQGRGDVEGRPESNGQHDGWPLGGEAQDLRDHHGSPQNVTGDPWGCHGDTDKNLW